MRTERLERALRLIHTLQARQASTVDELAKLIGVSRRTIFRDLKTLSAAGLPYAFDHATHKYSAANAEFLPPSSLTQREALALLLGTRIMAEFGVIPDQAAVQSAMSKLGCILPGAMLDACGPLLRRTEFRPPPISDSSTIAAVLPVLQEALSRRSKLRVRYDFGDGREILPTIVHPYCIAFIQRAWYLFAYSENYGCVRSLNVARILDLLATQSKYRIDSEFSLDAFLGNAWIMSPGKKRFHVQIRFRHSVAADVEQVRWHKTQQTHYLADGSLILEADVDGIGEVLNWVLGFGDQAEVEEPQELQELVASQARGLCEIYKGMAFRAKRA